MMVSRCAIAIASVMKNVIEMSLRQVIEQCFWSRVTSSGVSQQQTFARGRVKIDTEDRIKRDNDAEDRRP